MTKAQLIELKNELTNVLISEEASLDWWICEMNGFDGDIAMREHHRKQVKRIKKALKTINN